MPILYLTFTTPTFTLLEHALHTISSISALFSEYKNFTWKISMLMEGLAHSLTFTHDKNYIGSQYKDHVHNQREDNLQLNNSLSHYD